MASYGRPCTFAESAELGSAAPVPLSQWRALVLLASGCWTSYGYDLNNSRAVESKITPANAGQLHELWRVSGTVGSTSTPAVYGNTVYFGAWDGSLRAVSAATGAPIWTRQLGELGGRRFAARLRRQRVRR